MAKKKKSRKRKSTRGAEADQRRRERLEARRREKAEAEARQRRAERIARIRRRAIYAAALVLVVWFFFFRTTTPSVIEGRFDDYEVLSFSDVGLNVHTTNPVPYDPEEHGVNPPTSGPHDPRPAACGVHGRDVPDEQMVHSLEHGAVGIFYVPDLETGDIRSIEAIVRDYDSEVLSAPYEDMEAQSRPDMDVQVAVASWARKIELDRFDEDAIRNYIDAFRGRGPEPGGECPATANQPFQPLEEPEEDEEPDQEEPEEHGGGGGGP
jgi:hypothetical protein